MADKQPVIFGTENEIAEQAIRDIAPDLPIRETETDIAYASTLLEKFAARPSAIEKDPERAARHFDLMAKMNGTTPEEEKKNYMEATERVCAAAAEVQEFITSSNFMQLAECFKDYAEWIKGINPQLTLADLIVFGSILKEYKELLPFIVDEAKALKESGVVVSLAEFMRNIDGQGNSKKSFLEAAVEKAKENKAITEQQAAEIPRIVALLPSKIDYPLDKVNANIWEDLTSCGNALTIGTERRGSKKQADISYSIDFSGIEERTGAIGKLTAKHKRVMLAGGALYNAGNEYTTYTQLYYAMGNKGNPSAADIEEIAAIVDDLRRIPIAVDNTHEVAVNKGYPHFRYRGAVMPTEECQVIVKGKLCESAIYFFREPPLIQFARDRKQISTISVELLCSPVSKTEANLRIDDYLLQRILHMKNSEKLSRKILYSSLCDNCCITGSKQKFRVKDKVKRYLDHYVKCKVIKRYESLKDGVIIHL